MVSCFHRSARPSRRAQALRALPASVCLVAALFAGAPGDWFSPDVYAQQSRTLSEGVYTDAQATRGQAIFSERCAPCHGDTLGGGLAPPLTGAAFVSDFDTQPVSDLVEKIHRTMPANDPGTLTTQQATDIVAYILKVGKFPAGKAELPADEASLKQIAWPAGNAPPPRPTAAAAAQLSASRPLGNLAQVMRGILFPSSNIIFNVQTQDPSAPRTVVPGAGANASFSWVDWGAGIYTAWELVDYASVTLADVAPLLLVPGRRCENGRPVPVDRADWVKFTQDLVDAGRAAYKASQSRNQEAVSQVTEQVAEACLNCHVAYRDKPGGTKLDPSNKAARCIP
jgi:mono/diheme cytochrome c family protein